MVNKQQVSNDQRLPALATYSYRPNMFLRDRKAEYRVDRTWIITHLAYSRKLILISCFRLKLTYVTRAIRSWQSMLQI